ncbi:hypothetical protein BN1708_019282, partial [Verticillium longisporum]
VLQERDGRPRRDAARDDDAARPERVVGAAGPRALHRALPPRPHARARGRPRQRGPRRGRGRGAAPQPGPHGRHAAPLPRGADLERPHPPRQHLGHLGPHGRQRPPLHRPAALRRALAPPQARPRRRRRREVRPRERQGRA